MEKAGIAERAVTECASPILFVLKKREVSGFVLATVDVMQSKKGIAFPYLEWMNVSTP